MRNRTTAMQPEHPHLHDSPHRLYPTRRDFLRVTGSGPGLLAHATLLQQDAGASVIRHPSAVGPMSPRPPHFPARARSVIWLFMNGGPSQVDTWDYKPGLGQHDGQALKG